MAPLPRGTVTLVFSDVEGSTKLLRELRERYGEVVKEHRALLRGAYAVHGGRIVDAESDATLAVFRRAADALAGAAAAQRALAASELGVRVRMGVHTGEPEARDGRYFGFAVNRGARICAAAHGGQVLVSEVTAAIAAADELRGVTLADRGVYRLKDFDGVERLFQLDIDGLPGSFPPLAGAAEAPSVRPHRRWAPITIAAAFCAVGAAAAGFVVFRGEDAAALTRVPPNHVGVVDPDRMEIIGAVRVGKRPTSVAARGQSVWVTNADDGTVSQIDARRRAVQRVVSVGGDPTSVAVGGSTVWVAGLHGRRGAELTRLGGDAETVVPVTRIDTRLLVRTGVAPTVLASKDRVLVGVGRELLHVDAVSGATRVAHPADEIAGLTFGHGSVWLGDQGSLGLLRLDPRTYEVTARIDLHGTPRALASGANAVWVLVTSTALTGRFRLVRVDPGSDRVASEIDLGAGSFFPSGFTAAIAVGEGGVWLVSQQSSDLLRVDEETEEVERIPLGTRPEGLAVGAGYVWVTVY